MILQKRNSSVSESVIPPHFEPSLGGYSLSKWGKWVDRLSDFGRDNRDGHRE